MSNSLDNNNMEDSPESGSAQGQEWATLSIAVRPDLKARIRALAASQQVRPSQLSRMILLDGVGRMERAA